jgi:SpoVK/Ycf46/Vps4 family AAA+-type ATPase
LEKNITKVFDEAKNEDCVLVFDEADSLFSQRQNDPQRNDRTYNYMTNILMYCIPGDIVQIGHFVLYTL